jgi:hypothetical protein
LLASQPACPPARPLCRAASSSIGFLFSFFPAEAAEVEVYAAAAQLWQRRLQRK